MKPRVKFCGMTREEDIRAAEEFSIDFIGLIFVASSPRSVTVREAEKLRGTIKRAKVVGVFMDQSPSTVNETGTSLRLDYVQLHGKPDLKKIESITLPVIQAFRGVPDTATLSKFMKACAYILIDKADGEDCADFEAIAALPSAIKKKLFLAGGLTPENVHDAVKTIHPFAVDCARGIESSPGRKSLARMTDFLHSLPS
jgi:phosphoribosylanthranilate isomerase